MNKSEELAKVSKNLMLREPFYGTFLIMLHKVWKRIENFTAGVGKNGINYMLYMGEQFWESLTEPQREGLLKHELLHIGFFHLTDFEHLTDGDISNIAKDIEINQYIAEHMLPPGPQLPETYPELNLERRKGAQYYYNELLKAKQNPGTCPNLDAMLAGMGQGQITVQLNVPGRGTEDVQCPNHGDWGEFEDLSDAEKKLIRTQTEHVLKEVAEQVRKSCGNIPGEFSEILDKLTDVPPPKFDWRGYLRRFTGGSQEVMTKKMRRKFNKRYEENPGIKLKPKRHILVAIDTSGSVSTKELYEFMSEIHHIHKSGTEVTICQCDTEIRSIEKYNRHHSDIKVHGRGGTYFEPVIEYYNNHLHNYTCLVYFTDGEAGAPPAARGRMLWVLSEQSSINESLIGPQIRLN